MAFAFLESIDLAKKCRRGWGVSTRMAVISTRQGEKPINNFYGPGILLFMANLYSDALNASVATLGVGIVEAIQMYRPSRLDPTLTWLFLPISSCKPTCLKKSSNHSSNQDDFCSVTSQVRDLCYCKNLCWEQIYD